jgi:hypothetical protein
MAIGTPRRDIKDIFLSVMTLSLSAVMTGVAGVRACTGGMATGTISIGILVVDIE